MDGRPVLPVWTLSTYGGPVRELVVAWKDGGRADLTRPLARAVRLAARDLAPVLAAGAGAAPGARRASGGGALPLLVVPAPSTAAARRRRGEDPVGDLAGAVVRGCADVGVAAEVRSVLARRGRGRDQVGLGARARGRNLAGQVVVRRRASAGVRGRVVLLVDDILTTGATLAASERAVAAHGGIVAGALTLSATPPPGHAGAALVPTVAQV